MRKIDAPNAHSPFQIRLITEAVPEMGRIHGSLTRSSETYSLNGRVWSGAQSLAVVSYGVANNDTIKSSHTVTVVAPALPWSRAELMVEADHLGTLPLNFQVQKTVTGVLRPLKAPKCGWC